MERRKRRWRLGCVVAGAVLGLSVLGGLVYLVRHLESARRKPGPVVLVVTTYPGISAPAVENLITNRVERWVNQAEGAASITSRSLNGVSIVRVSFRNDVDPTLAPVNLLQLVGGVQPLLPAGTPPPLIVMRDPNADDLLGFVTVSDPEATAAKLGELARTPVRERLQAQAGAVMPVVLGGEVVRPDEPGEAQARPAAPEVRFRIDGRPAVGVPVYPQSGANPRDVRTRIAGALPSLQHEITEARLRWVPLRAGHKWLREDDDGLLTIYLRGPSNSRPADTEKRVTAVEGLLRQSIPESEREAILSVIGMEPDLSAVYTANAGPMDATIRVQLSGDRTLSAGEYAARLRGGLNDDPQFADLHVRFASRDMPPPVDVRITSRRLAEDVRRRLASINGAVDVDIAQRQDGPSLVLHVDRRKAKEVGLEPAVVLKQALAALHAKAEDPTLRLDGEVPEEVSVAVPPLSDLDQLTKTEATGTRTEQPIKLSSLVTVRRTTVPVEIDHVGLLRVFDVRADVEGRSRRDVLADIRKMFQELQVPDGVRVELVE